MKALGFIILIAYSAAAYWAVNRTIFTRYAMFGDLFTIILRKWLIGVVLGPVCIPIAAIKTLLQQRERE